MFVKYLERAAILMAEIWLWYTENPIESTSMYLKNSSGVFKQCSNFNYLFKYQFVFIVNTDASSTWNIFSQVYHPDMETYFSGYDGSKYIMQPWLKKLYPHDWVLQCLFL